MVWQMNFTREVRMPTTVSGHCILRTRYVSHNQDEVDPATNHDAIFYNCADITLVPGNRSADAAPSVASASATTASAAPNPRTATSSSPTRATRASQPTDCCTRTQWTASAYSQTSSEGTTVHQIAYDAKANMVRWSRRPLEDPTAELITLTNYTSGSASGGGPFLEYLYRPQQNTCEVYGADHFYAWCFGSTRSQSYVGSYTAGDVPVNEYRDASNGFQFAATADQCYPYSLKQGELSMQFTGWQAGVDPALFEVPAICHAAARGVSLVACGRQRSQAVN
jgi:hypothetical protein